MSRYDRVWFHGKLVDKYTRAALQACERDLGYELTILQGSYSGGVSASAGTHDGGGAADLAAYDHVRKVKALRSNGFAAWYRPYLPGYWNPHVHCIQIGNTKASPAAKRQVTAYYNGRNGLANNAWDHEWRPKSISPFKYSSADPKPPTPTPKDTDMPDDFYKQMYKTKQSLRGGKWDYVQLGKGNVTLLFGNNATVFGGKVCFRVTGLKGNDRIYVQSVRSTKRGKVTTSVTSLGTDNFGGEYFQYPIAGTLARSHNSRLRIKIKAPRKGCRIEYVWPMIPNWK